MRVVRDVLLPGALNTVSRIITYQQSRDRKIQKFEENYE